MTQAINIPLASLSHATAKQVVIAAILQQLPHLRQKEVVQLAKANKRTVSKLQRKPLTLDFTQGYLVLPTELLQRMSPLAALLTVEFATLEVTHGKSVISNRKLAQKYHCSVFSIKKAKCELRKKGYLTQKARYTVNGGQRWQVANSYQVTFQAFGDTFVKVARTIKFFSRKRWVKRVTANKKLNKWMYGAAVGLMADALTEERKNYRFSIY